MIVFGVRNVRIKSINPFDLGLTNNSLTNSTIEVRQDYFHLFWIPFFGIGKNWVIRRDNKLFEIPNEYRQTIENYKSKVRTPWYIYSGFFLIAIIFGLVYLNEKIEVYNSRQADIRWIDKKTNRIKNPEIGDIYDFIADGGNYEIQVKEIAKDSLLFKVPNVDYNNGKYQTTIIKDDDAQGSSSVWIPKNDLFKSCAKTPEEFNDFKGIPIKKLEFLTKEKLRLDRIDRKSDNSQ